LVERAADTVLQWRYTLLATVQQQDGEKAMSEAVTLAPVRGRERIAVIDILRGVAILGIFFINLPAMMGPLSALLGDPRGLGWSPADQTTWLFMNTFLEGTQRGMLEFLFGAGLMVTAAKAMEGDGPVAVADLYIRRNLWLLAFGLFDIFALLWVADILHIYALCALALFPFRKLKVKWLITLGLSLAMLQLVIGALEYVSRSDLQQTHQVAVDKQAKGQKLTKDETAAVKQWQEKVDKIAKGDPEVNQLTKDETKARAGSMGDYAGFLISTYVWAVGKGSLLFGVLEAFAVMLLGIALWKLGFIQGKRTTREYLVALILAYGFGLTARYLGGLERLAFAPIPKTIWMTTELARIAVSIGHVAAINLLVRAAAGRRLLAPFKAAGQVAFTLYLMQQVIGIWLFYSPVGLHLPSGQGWACAAGLAALVVLFQLTLANLWLRWFVAGPVEWLWRSLSYCQKQPFRRRPQPAAAATGT
jgi:uncharacterized protein